MKFRRLIYIFLAIITAVSAIDFIMPTELSATEAAASKRKKSSSKKKKKKSRKNNKKKSGRRSNKSGKKKNRRSGRVSAGRRAPAAPKETPSYDSLTLAVNDAVVARIPKDQNPGGLRVNSVKTDKRSRTARLSLNENFTYLPVTRELIDHIRKSASTALPDSLADYNITLNVGNRSLAYYITKVDKLPADKRQNPPFVTALTPLATPRHGMTGDIVALWHSHGRYFRPGAGAWMWQRPLLFQTAEDLFTMGFILPYAVPMLENAGAYVMLPRERDVNRNEVIVDNDTYEGGQVYSQPYYKEMTGSKPWATGEEEGFIYDLPDFRDTENPFENGTYRQTTTVRGGKPSVAAWYADIPEDGEYAVYVSYKTLPNSTTDARYTVNYSGGSKQFKVNQTMGGSTWTYLGTFPFKAGYSDKEPLVTLSNITEKESGTVVTADAVKIGGGMGNIARSNHRRDIYYDPSTPEKDLSQAKQTSGDEEGDEEDDESDDETDETDEDITDDGNPDGQAAPAETPAAPVNKGAAPVFRTSGMPRFLEGARYWLQWAGFPENVYSPYHGSDDYKDDYTDRGMWVNYLAGGSRVLPGREGLNIPVDAVMALHSDAGKRSDDSFVGTLGIYYTANGDSYADGTPRINSRMLTDMLMRQITGDIRKSLEPSWTRRQMWDKSYLEARVPEVPTSLIELLSHQNFADMQYGLDPHFRFVVGRAIYKSLGRFIAQRKDREFIVQPLPVADFAIRRTGKGKYRLSWKAVTDSLEPTATPSKYILLERTGSELGFHKVGETKATHFDVSTSDKLIHSFRVIAANDGGLSFPSETLALRDAGNDSKPVLIVNGFQRISAPEHFSSDGRAGFNSEEDFGVPYIRDISFTGYQTEYRRSAGESFGRSGSGYAATVIAGNTFDYPAVHGEAVAASGRGFVSCSAGAVADGTIKLSNYKTVDWILGKQKTTLIGRGKSGVRYQSFSPACRKALAAFVDHGGRLLVSGQYVVSDLYDYRNGDEGPAFAAGTLGVVPDTLQTRSRSGAVSLRAGAMGSEIQAGTLNYSNTLNERQYIVERPDVLAPAPGVNAVTVMTMTDTGLPAGILTRQGKGRTAVFSVPLEILTDPAARTELMTPLLDWLEE